MCGCWCGDGGVYYVLGVEGRRRGEFVERIANVWECE